MKDDNPHLGWSSNRLDWLEFQTTFGVVVVRREDRNRGYILIQGNSDQNNLTKALDAVQTAISFVEGRNVEIVGYEKVSDGKRTRSLGWTTSTTKSRFVPPFGWTKTIPMNMEGFLSLATNYFYSDAGEDVADRLGMCWAVADNKATARAIAACGTVDKLTQQAANDERESFGDSELKALKEIKSYVETKRGSLDDRFLNRVNNFLETMRSPDTRNTLKRWAQSGRLGIVQEDLEAYIGLRNPIMHGRLMFKFAPDDEQAPREMFEKLRRVENLVNKIILDRIGYGGNYFDHVTNRFGNLKR